MGILTPLTGVKTTWKWGPTEQRAFEEVKEIVHRWRNHHRVSMDYNADALTINLVTDASCTGASGYVSQGKDLKMAKVIAFWSGKFNSAQQNYPVHEQELLAIVESLKRFRGLLHGTKFRILTDHRSLEHLMAQKNLSPRQHRWLDILNEFDFTIRYIPGESNELADALSRIYSDEPLGTQRAPSEFVSDDDPEAAHRSVLPQNGVGEETPLTAPVFTGATAVLEGALRRSARLADKPIVDYDKDSSSASEDSEPEPPKRSRQRKAPRKEQVVGGKETGHEAVATEATASVPKPISEAVRDTSAMPYCNSTSSCQFLTSGRRCRDAERGPQATAVPSAAGQTAITTSQCWRISGASGALALSELLTPHWRHSRTADLFHFGEAPHKTVSSSSISWLRNYHEHPPNFVLPYHRALER
uniref:Reverse transcriptase RNase H-like domain-containing protein n=1 Tax=Mycena chlorophos TaxID=658473 RepID=A0ABQ0L5R1_MYCCL|nr:predicted protein [Mycena chlorophos]